jgi:hypothetical protein
MENRKCTKCGEEFPATREYFYPFKQGKYGLSSRCKACHKAYTYEWRANNRDRLNASVKERFSKNRGQQKHYQLKYKYGLSIEEYEAALQKQAGVCAICGCMETEKHQNGTVKKLNVDHNHETGQVRGLLCSRCNRVIGYTKENKELLKSIVDYLRYWSEYEDLS